MRRDTGSTWSVPVAIALPNLEIAAALAVAADFGTADAEFAFADKSAGVAYHARLVSGFLVTRRSNTGANGDIERH